MKKKSIIIGILGVVTCISLGVGIIKIKNSNINIFKNGAEILSKKEDYEVITKITFPDSELSYLEVNSNEGNYTEYPYNESEKKISETIEANSSYILYDWLTKDDELYRVNYDYKEGSEDSMWFKMPKEYAKLVSKRKTLYSDIIEKGLKNIKESEIEKLDLGLADMPSVRMYKGIVKSDTIKELMSIDVLSLDTILRKDKANSDKLNEHLDTIINENNMKLTFSDGKITFGVYDNQLVYYKITTGGIGNTMTIEKTVVFSDIEKRALPTFSNSVMDYRDYIDKGVSVSTDTATVSK